MLAEGWSQGTQPGRLGQALEAQLQPAGGLEEAVPPCVTRGCRGGRPQSFGVCVRGEKKFSLGLCLGPTVSRRGENQTGRGHCGPENPGAGKTTALILQRRRRPALPQRSGRPGIHPSWFMVILPTWASSSPMHPAGPLPPAPHPAPPAAVSAHITKSAVSQGLLSSRDSSVPGPGERKEEEEKGEKERGKEEKEEGRKRERGSEKEEDGGGREREGTRLRLARHDHSLACSNLKRLERLRLQ